MIVDHFWVLAFRFHQYFFLNRLLTCVLILLIRWTFILFNASVVVNPCKNAVYLLWDIYLINFLYDFFLISFFIFTILFKLDFQTIFCLLFWWIFKTLRIMLRVVFHKAFWRNWIFKNVFVDFCFTKIVQSALRCGKIVLKKYLQGVYQIFIATASQVFNVIFKFLKISIFKNILFFYFFFYNFF